MADYYPLIARAVEALSERSPEMRRAVYERARSALTAQLRSLEPPLAEADIARERLALDDAVDRIEADYASVDHYALEMAGPAAFSLPTVAPRQPPTLPLQPDYPEAMPPDPRQARADAPLARPLPDFTDRLAAEDEPGAAAEPRERPRVAMKAPAAPRAGRLRSALLAVILAVVIGAIAVVAWLLRDNPSEFPHEQAAATTGRPAPEPDAKLADRMAGDRPAQAQGAPQPAAPASAPRGGGDLAVAQRAVLYEENPSDPQAPKASAGRTLWRLDTVNVGQGQPLETVVRATVEFADPKISLAMVIRRNTDATLPASHTIELTFTTPPDRAVRDVGLLQLKSEEAVRGTPVAGLPVPVKDNVFLIGLSNLKSDVERNTDLLLHRNWIDLPVRFASGQRAIMSFEKGLSGEQVVAQALQQWSQQQP